MMSEWTEYRAGDEWPEGDNLEWQVRNGTEWKSDCGFIPEVAWDVGHRIRYREREAEMVKVSFSDDGSICYIGKVIDRWMFLAAPIAAYYKDMKYMALDGNKRVHVYKNKPDNTDYPDEWNTDEEYKLIAVIPPEAMPADWEAAIVELVHEEDGDES
jgi:hypothetical protein